MQIIKNNPYRIVGLLVGATAREQERQIKRLKQFIEAEQEPEADFSFPSLGNLVRTIENVTEVASKLNLDSDKMQAALFWFYKGNAITDEPAFDFLKESDEQNAHDIWQKLTTTGEISHRNSSAFQNLSTLMLSNAFSALNVDLEFLEQGITLKLKFLESDFVQEFKSISTDETYKISKKELQMLFLTQVQLEVEKSDKINSVQLVEILIKQEFSAKDDFLNAILDKPIASIKEKIDETRSEREAYKGKALKKVGTGISF